MKALRRLVYSVFDAFPILLRLSAFILFRLDPLPRLRRKYAKPGGALPRRRQLLLDISRLAEYDAKTGIQRVVRSISHELIYHPPEGYAVYFVRSSDTKDCYVYAHHAALNIFGYDDGLKEDAVVRYSEGDIFIGLDLSWLTIPLGRYFLKDVRNLGVRIYFCVYDLIPVQYPEYSHIGSKIWFYYWLDTITGFDGALCISKSTADALKNWMSKNCPERLEKLKISWFHLGCDIQQSVPTTGLPQDSEFFLAHMGKAPSVLVVSTIEPRKGYGQILAAFEYLWEEGINVNLFIVGVTGWKVGALIKKISNHPENGRRLFKLEKVSDEFLERLYDKAAAVLMASEAEGFGLAVVEGAMHGKPLILRDIPVFREIAGDNAFYFKGHDPAALACAIKGWLLLYRNNSEPSSENINILTWKESANMLMKNILNQN